MDILHKLANFTENLLNYDPEFVIISRNNFKRDDVTINYIVIESIPSNPIGRFKRYDPVAEQEIITTRYTGDFQISFYGTDALVNSLTWQNMLLSELAFELAYALGIKIFRNTSHNNIKIQDGTNFDELYQLDVKVAYDETTIVPTLRIDIPQLDFVNNK